MGGELGKEGETRSLAMDMGEHVYLAEKIADMWFYGCSFIMMSQQTTVNEEALLIGLESCLAVYPLYLLVLWVFRAARGKVNPLKTFLMAKTDY